MRVTALRYDSETGELMWAEKWTDFRQGPYDRPEWHKIVTLSPGTRIERSVPSHVNAFLDERRILSFDSWSLSGEYTIYDLDTGDTWSGVYPDEGRKYYSSLAFIDGQNACIIKSLGSYEYQLQRASIGSDGIEVGDFLIERIKMVSESGSPSLVSMSADGSTVAWSDDGAMHAYRISWMVDGKIHTYIGGVESAILSQSGKFLYVIDRDSDDRVRVIDTTTAEVRTLAVYPFKSAGVSRDESSDDVVIHSIGDVVTVMSPEGHIKRVFNLLAKEGDDYWDSWKLQ